MGDSNENGDQKSYWESVWVEGVKPGQYFDKEGSLPELVSQVQSCALPKGERAIIPGCGRGYDVELLSRSGLFKEVLGIEISPTASEAAKKYLSDVTPPLPSNYDILVADFFLDKLPEADLVYDYTFFCAISPEVRKDWGEKMKNIIKPGGSLITAMYPVDDYEDGPPFAVSVEAYKIALGTSFEPVDGPRKLGDSAAHASRKDRSWWCRWKRV